MRAGRLRIISGDWRSRRLRVPDGIRPSQDAHRETLFNVLGGAVGGADCLDLFAGTGSLGLEALSRGARHVTFVERSRRVAKTLRQNVGALGAGARATVLVSDAARMLRGAARRSWSLAFVDPPFADCGRDGWWEGFMGSLSARLDSGAVACCEAPRPVRATPGWEPVRAGRVGAAHWAVLRRT